MRAVSISCSFICFGILAFSILWRLLAPMCFFLIQLHVGYCLTAYISMSFIKLQNIAELNSAKTPKGQVSKWWSNRSQCRLWKGSVDDWQKNWLFLPLLSIISCFKSAKSLSFLPYKWRTSSVVLWNRNTKHPSIFCFSLVLCDSKQIHNTTFGLEEIVMAISHCFLTFYRMINPEINQQINQ